MSTENKPEFNSAVRDSRFESIMIRKQWDADLCRPVFEKCKDFTLLRGDEYLIAEQLSEVGLMEVWRKPIHNQQGNYVGKKVYFKSVFETTNDAANG